MVAIKVIQFIKDFFSSIEIALLKNTPNLPYLVYFLTANFVSNKIYIIFYKKHNKNYCNASNILIFELLGGANLRRALIRGGADK